LLKKKEKIVIGAAAEQSELQVTGSHDFLLWRQIVIFTCRPRTCE